MCLLHTKLKCYFIMWRYRVFTTNKQLCFLIVGILLQKSSLSIDFLNFILKNKSVLISDLDSCTLLKMLCFIYFDQATP